MTVTADSLAGQRCQSESDSEPGSRVPGPAWGRAGETQSRPGPGPGTGSSGFARFQFPSIPSLILSRSRLPSGLHRASAAKPRPPGGGVRLRPGGRGTM